MVKLKHTSFVINHRFITNDWLFVKTINDIYSKDGIAGIYKFLWEQRLRILEDKTTKYMDSCDGKILWKAREHRYQDIILRTLRDRYLHRKLISKVKHWLTKPKVLNEVDLCYNAFYDENGQVINKYVQLQYDKSIFNFSRSDIENIMCNSLEARDNIRFDPMIPKNPYNGKVFNIYQLKILYDFLINSQVKTEVSCYNKTSPLDNIPEIIRLFRYSNFNLDKFKFQFDIYLKIRSCENYTDELNNKELAKDVIIAFKVFKIKQRPNLHYIEKYLDKYRYQLTKIISQFYYLYYYIEFDKLPEDDLISLSEEFKLIENTKEKLTEIKREIFIVGNSERKRIKYKSKRRQTQNNIDMGDFIG